MKDCFLFGHSDCPDSVSSRIEEAIHYHYMNYEVRNFYIGSRGRFDSLAAAAAKRVKQRHPDLRLYLLLAYHPGERKPDLTDGFDNSFYPPVEGVPKPYAIVRANQYMVDTADTIICYVKHVGNTKKLLEYAQRRQDKTGVIIENVAEYR